MSELQGQLIFGALAIAFFTPLVAAGIDLTRRRQDLAPVGYLTALATAIAAGVVLEAVWSDSFPFGGSQTPIYALLIGLAIAQIPVLFVLADESDPPWVPLLRGATLVAVVLTTMLTIEEISNSGSDGNVGAMATGSAVYGFGAITLLLVALLRRPAPGDPGPEVAATPGPAQLEYVDHLCFAWGGSAESAIDHLHSHGLHVLGSPTPRTGAHGRGQSIFFHDSAGRLVELIVYG